MQRKNILFIIALLLCTLQTGCLLTKVVTVPLRVIGAGISIIPVAGNPVDDSLDEVADAVDKIPL